MRLHFVFLFLMFSLTVYGQNGQHQIIQGILLNGQTNEPVPFAKIYNYTLGKGVLTNFEGSFSLTVSSNKDSVIITCIGYKRQEMLFQLNEEQQIIRLDKNMQLLEQVMVFPKDNGYLFDLLNDCRKNVTRIPSKGKAVYELKSYIDSTQTELVEGYYNYSAAGYDLIDYELKAGRIAVKPIRGRSFLSTESSRAISLLKTGQENAYFPISPLELSRRKMMNEFYLRLESKYVDANLDSIYIIEFIPKDDVGGHFNGRVWVNKTKGFFIKVNTNCAPCLVHPFSPLFPDDTLVSVRMNVTKTFLNKGITAVFNHVDFNYEVDYKTRVNQGNEGRYTAKSRAVMYAYDTKNTFDLPNFRFSEMAQIDYRKILALPYNSFFWTFNEEDKFSANKMENERFYESFSNFKLDNGNSIRTSKNPTQGIFEGNFIRWSKTRVVFQEKTDALKLSRPQHKAQLYNLSVKIFYDKNVIGGITNILTATIFDPFESFYYLPIDNQTLCFINMYFDICEIARREFEKAIKTQNMDPDLAYTATMKSLQQKQNEFLRDTERGTQERAMVKWNSYIVQALGIDNFEIFNPFPNPEKK